jgi:hypothetical protein
MDDETQEAGTGEDAWDQAHHALALAINDFVRLTIAGKYPEDRRAGFARAKALAIAQFDDIEAVLDQPPWSLLGLVD